MENKQFTDEQYKAIQELNLPFPVYQDASKMTADDLSDLHAIAAEEALDKGGLMEDDVNLYGYLMESIMDFIEDNFPFLFEKYHP